jgi:hypothetical protein
MDDDRLIEAAVVDPEDRAFDVALRPTSLSDFVGQERVKEQLQLLVDGARRRGEPVDHLLFSGPPEQEAWPQAVRSWRMAVDVSGAFGCMPCGAWARAIWLVH